MSEPLQELHRFLWFFGEGAYKQGPLLTSLLEKGRDVFDGPIQSLPFPSEVPPDVPRIILRNQSGNFILHSSPDRISVERVYKNPQGSSKILDELAAIVDLLQTAREATSGRVNRVAYNRHRAFASTDNAMHLVRYFCLPEKWSRETDPPGPLSRCENFEIHSHKVYEVPLGFRMNSWMRCRSAISDSQPVILVVQDLNTLAEEAETRDFPPDSAFEILSWMTQESEGIFDLYFPDGVQT